MEGLISDELRQLIGRDFPPILVTITEEGVRRYCQAFGREYDGRVPWLYLTHVGAEQAPALGRADALSGRAAFFPIDLPLKRVVVGSMDWEYGRRPQIGDELTMLGRYTSLEERQGQRSRSMIVSVLEVRFLTAAGEHVATQRLTRIHR